MLRLLWFHGSGLAMPASSGTTASSDGCIPQSSPYNALASTAAADMRASTAVFGDLRKACEGQGLDDIDDDFQLQVGW